MALAPDEIWRTPRRNVAESLAWMDKSWMGEALSRT